MAQNGSFTNSFKHWNVENGYTGSPRPLGSDRPDISGGCLRLGVAGGTQYARQKIPVTDLNLTLKGRFRVERWSTFGGKPGGWAALGLSFVDKRGKYLATTYYYLNPHGDSTSSPGIHWVKLGSGLPTPTNWIQVHGDVMSEIGYHNLDPDQVKYVSITAYVFGTHENKTKTVACFDDLSLTRNQHPKTARTPGDADGWLGVWEVKTYAKGCPGRKSFR